MASTPPTVVGLDMSLTATGIAWPTGRVVSFGKPGLTTMAVEPKAVALGSLAEQLAWMVTADGKVPDLVCVEGLELHSRSSGGLAERCYLWFQVVRALLGHGVHVVEVAPTKLKTYATGKGTVTKGAMVDSLARRLPQFATAGDDNKADAAWLCAIGMDAVGQPLTTVPATHRRALAEVLPFIPEQFRTADVPQKVPPAKRASRASRVSHPTGS